ncbi:hypothetical protein HMPREF9699_00595, partial [Bergeyella zoohelcum ATCC 43767]
MNKTTIKISVLAFLGFMTYGYAQQQQQDPYKGKVGINTIEPSATMDIRPSTANAQKEATTNEGIIAPKLSKTRIANIATPVEGTLVYATDETTSPISAYTGGDTKVAKITEKGYYFYNGTEWVKAGSDVTDQLWAQRDNGGVTETYLKAANGDNNTVQYRNNGVFELKLGNPIATDFDWKDGKALNVGKTPFGLYMTSDVFPQTGYGTLPTPSSFSFSHNQGLIKESHVNGKNNPYYLQDETRIVIKDVTSPIGNIFATVNSADVFSNNTVAELIGLRGITSAGNETYTAGTVGTNIAGQFIARNNATSTNMYGVSALVRNLGKANLIRGVYADVHSQSARNGVYATSSADYVYGTDSNVYLTPNSTIGNHAIALRGFVRAYSNSTTENLVNNFLYTDVQQDANVKNLYGVRVSSSVNSGANVTNSYGVYVNSMKSDGIKGEVFSIYTNNGYVYFGDRVGVGTKTPMERLEVSGNILSNGGLKSSINASNGLGGYVELINDAKTGGTLSKRWRIYNMQSQGTNNYADGLHFWGYAEDGTNLGSKMILTDEGNLNIGFGSAVISNTPATQKLNIKGNVLITELQGTGDRPVFVTADGVLKVGTASTIRSAWVPDTASNSVQLAITSANGDRTTHPISITDEGMVRATSFQGVNGATIFPDYVFQKYYTGTSSIKADYNFKSLSQVEDFVKTNGHLPGYKSAETIK